MTTLFFYGTLRYPALLKRVLGRDVPLIAGELPRHRTVWAAGESFPMIIPDAGACAPGVLATDLTPDDIARLDFYEGAFAYDLEEVTVETADGPVPAPAPSPAPARGRGP